MTTWTSPSTEPQSRYYSKHKGKLQAYQLTGGLVQVIWGCFDFPAYKALLDAAFEYVPFLLWTTGYLAAVLLLIMHYILRETYQTFWFDRLDDDPNTDSSFFIPLILILALFIAGRWGVKMAVEGILPPPVTKDYVDVDRTFQERLGRIDAQHARTEAALVKTFDDKIAAAAMKVDAELAGLRRRSPSNWTEKQELQARIAELERRRASIVAPIAQAKTDSLAAYLGRYQSERGAVETKYRIGVDMVDQDNALGQAEHDQTLRHVGSGSWFISLLFVFLYCALSYASVRIRVKSGILPQRDHTVLDQYGGVLGRLVYVIQDAFNRQFYRLTIFLHRQATRGTAVLTEMDATYLEGKAAYNTPQLPAGQAIDPELVQRVMDKFGRHKISPTPQQFAVELEKAQRMNGTYDTEPLGK